MPGDRSGGSPLSASARELLERAVAERTCPAVAIEVGRRAGPLWTEAFGHLDYEAGAATCRLDTIFDLASLTKVVATTSIAMRAVAGRALSLDCPVRDLVPVWSAQDRASVTIRQLLDHSSGLPAHRPLWKDVTDPRDVEAAIAALPLVQPPGTASVYSDVGFILLGCALERALGGRLKDLFTEIGERAGATLRFNPPAALRDRIAPTEFDPWRGRLLRGEVHDENAALLGGVAGHAGLFGTVQDVGTFARLVLQTFSQATPLGDPTTMRAFAARSAVSGSSRALGWDTMLPTSSCGTKFSGEAIGHTGYTGTSLWLDPALDVYVALLSNRVYPTRANNRLHELRPMVHDAVLEDFRESLS